MKRVDAKIRAECPLLGKRVEITGTSQEDLHGKTGMATSFDHARERYEVALDEEGGALGCGMWRSVALSGEHLRSLS